MIARLSIRLIALRISSIMGQTSIAWHQNFLTMQVLKPKGAILDILRQTGWLKSSMILAFIIRQEIRKLSKHNSGIITLKFWIRKDISLLIKWHTWQRKLKPVPKRINQHPDWQHNLPGKAGTKNH